MGDGKVEGCVFSAVVNGFRASCLHSFNLHLH